MRRLFLGVSLMLLLIACSVTSATKSGASPALAEATKLATEAYTSLEAGDVDDGMVALDELTRRFSESSDPEISRVVARTLYNSGTVLGQTGRFEAALAPYRDLVELFADSTDHAVQSDVVDGLFNQGLAMHALDRHEDELAVFETIDMFRDSSDPDMAPRVAKALNNKGIALYELDRSYEEQLAAFDDVISRYGDSTDANMLPNLARALFSRGFALQAMGRTLEAGAAYQEVVSRYDASPNPAVAPFVSAAQQQLNELEL